MHRSDPSGGDNNGTNGTQIDDRGGHGGCGGYHGFGAGIESGIPFPFTAAGARMQPGTYELMVNHMGGAGSAVQIYDAASRGSVVAVSHLNSVPPTARDATPMLTFACTDGRCVLVSMRDEMSRVYGLGTAKAGPDTRIATVLLRPDRAE